MNTAINTKHKALDTYKVQEVVANAARLVAAGYTAVGLYLFRSSAFKQKLTRAAALAISKAGLYIFTVWENGQPTTAEYFSALRGDSDAVYAIEEAEAIGQPKDTPIYFAVDYDAKEADLAYITAYFRQVRPKVVAAGYKVGAYGSGMVLAHLASLGLIQYSWLSQSKGFAGYQAWKAKANIVQGASTTILGMDVDTDTINGNAGGWKIIGA